MKFWIKNLFPNFDLDQYLPSY